MSAASSGPDRHDAVGAERDRIDRQVRAPRADPKELGEIDAQPGVEVDELAALLHGEGVPHAEALASATAITRNVVEVAACAASAAIGYAIGWAAETWTG